MAWRLRRGLRPDRVDRRRLLGAAAAGVGLGALGLGARDSWHASTLAQGATPVALDAAPVPLASPATGRTSFVEPPVRASRDGVLETTLEALPDLSAGLGKMSYEGSIPGPTLRVRPGDRLRIGLINHLGGQDTNLHAHGLHVSPRGNSDNVFIHVANGERFDYEYLIPVNHPAGLFWYHPHVHGLSHDQVDGGLAGTIIVEGGLNDLPGFGD